jgi:hypothetical protein
MLLSINCDSTEKLTESLPMNESISVKPEHKLTDVEFLKVKSLFTSAETPISKIKSLRYSIPEDLVSNVAILKPTSSAYGCTAQV